MVDVMKKLVLALLLVSSPCFAQLPCDGRPCVYISSRGSQAPAAQVDAVGGPGIGLLAISGTGPAVWAGSATKGGTGLWAAGVNGATALHIQGPVYKAHEKGHRIKLYDPDTGKLIGEFEYSLE